MSKLRTYTVRSTRWRNHQKILDLGSKTLAVPRSACVSTGDRVSVNGTRAFVNCVNGRAQLLPSYVGYEEIDLGSLKLELIVKEITDAEELAACQSLVNFHYRDQVLFGRTAKLIIQSFHPSYPRTIGYIELTTPFYMNKSRTDILNRPFRSGPIEWESWSKDTARRSINLVVRIARCVVYPEFRGLGLGQKLIQHACTFARTRWQVGGLQPQFIEISADMLKYVPFVERAGLHFIGHTEGNLERVGRDLRYLLANRKRVRSGQIVKEEAFGIVDQQVSRLDRAVAIMRENGWSTTKLLSKLDRLQKHTSLKDLSLLQTILSLPKPTYFGGLTKQADTFVREALGSIDKVNGVGERAIAISPLTGPIQINQLSISHRSKVNRSKGTAAIQRAFGISPDDIQHDVVDGLSLTVEPGQVVMLVGPSGSGKTSVLRAIKAASFGRLSDHQPILVPSNFKVGDFSPIVSRKPLIEAIGTTDVSATLELMGTVSLSDAFVYLKRFDQLSAGQQYRALLAKLISSNSNVWLADEFCVNLDPVAANSVALRLSKLARSLKAVLIVATPQPELVARSLRPDTVVRLTTAWEHEIIAGSDYLRHLAPRASSFRVPSIAVAPAVLKQALKPGLGRAVVISGHVSARLGVSRLVAGDRSALVSILKVCRVSSSDIDLVDARKAGFPTKRSLHRRFGSETPITLIEIVRLD